MENEFVPYELALELKQLGFNEPCIRGWSMDKQVFYHPDSDVILDNPTFSQAFRWFRDNHNLYQQIGTILEINEESIKVYVPKRGTFLYLKSNLELIDRVPKSDCMDNTQ